MSDTREVYIEKLKNALDRWNEDLDQLQTKMNEAESSAKEQYREQITQMKERRNSAQEVLGQLQEATGEAWKEFRTGAERAWEALTQSAK